MKIISTLLFTLFSLSVYAQKTGDTIVSLVDTINIHGKVINEQGNAVANALIISGTYDEDFHHKITRTDKNGLFYLNGIKPIDRLLFSSEDGIADINNNNSRYLLIILRKLGPNLINANGKSFFVGAKKHSERKKIVLKQISRVLAFDEEKYDWQGEFPGGNYSLYNFLRKNLIYPADAIKNNVEGDVNVQFTLTKDAKLQDFLITQDIGYGCGKQVLKLLNSIKKWSPMIRNGQPVNSTISITIPFKLTD